jgi:hypothetical protein
MNQGTSRNQAVATGLGTRHKEVAGVFLKLSCC